MQQLPDGLLETHVENRGRMCQVMRRRGTTLEASTWEWRLMAPATVTGGGAVFGSEGSATESGVDDERAWVNQPAGLSMKAAG